MNEKIKVLVFPAHSIELHDALSSCVNIELWGASSKDMGAGFYYKNYIADLPLISDCDFIEKFNFILEKYQIDLIFTSHDTVALFLAEHKAELKAKLVASDLETMRICRSKRLTYKIFAGYDFIPHVYNSSQITFPAFLKPDEGQGAKGTRKIFSYDELPVSLDDYVICEYLPGKECSVDCLTDKNGNLKVISPRIRKRTLGGISVACVQEELSDEITQIAENINSRLHFLGLWFFQLKQDINGKWKLMEISARCAGTMGFTRALGINLPLLTVYVALGKEINIIKNSYKLVMSRELFSRFQLDYQWKTVYFDFDDTLIVREKINLMAISFLYYCKNNNKKVILLTKHISSIRDSIEKYSISPALFDEIININPGDKKSDFIQPDKAIFIDNAFQERKEVFERFHIPVFDVDNIDTLIDWRS